MTTRRAVLQTLFGGLAAKAVYDKVRGIWVLPEEKRLISIPSEKFFLPKGDESYYPISQWLS